MVSPYSAGTFTLQEAPSFAWRTNGSTFSRETRGQPFAIWNSAARGSAAAKWCYASFACETPFAVRSIVGQPEAEQLALRQWCFQKWPQFPLPLLRHFETRSTPVLFELEPDPIPEDISFHSSHLLSFAPKRAFRLRPQFIRRYERRRSPEQDQERKSP